MYIYAHDDKKTKIVSMIWTKLVISCVPVEVIEGIPMPSLQKH